MSVLHSALGYAALLLCGWLSGRRQGSFPWKTVAVATALQLALTGLLLRPAVRRPLFGFIDGFIQLLKSTAMKAGESLLFSGLSNQAFVSTYGPVFVLELASILVFVAALSRVLYHYRVLPWVIGQLSRCMQRLLGISAAESVGTAANIFLGMTEAPLLIRPYIGNLTESELFCVMVSGMATIAGTVMVVYSVMLSPVDPGIAGHIFIASLISAPAAVAVAKVMLPESGQPETAGSAAQLPREDTLNGLDAAARGAAEGMHLVINIVAMLIAFIGLVALANAVIGHLDRLVHGAAAGGWSLQSWTGTAFRPFVWLMGISWAESRIVGELMGVKTILNEFVAYAQLAARMQGEAPLTHRGFVITTYALCGFANFGSVAIMIGGIGGIAPERRGDLARLGIRSIVAGTLATMMTGCVIGAFLQH